MPVRSSLRFILVVRLELICVECPPTVPCSNYLCPNTLVCVALPSDCPCPDVQDVKCLIPDAQDQGASAVVCVRGQEECQDVQRKSRKI
ncbi:hypothetical protein C2E23DRAFT_297916 [Lenzites betulinus]|nr:hypothetical protein C2E23DRAFT_297916 [Lenzites betulinus]